MRLFTLTLAAIACTFGLTLAGCAPSSATAEVQSGVTTSSERTADAKSDCADCAGCADKSECAGKAECADKADCKGKTCDGKKAKQSTDSVYPADSAPAKGVPAGSSSAPSQPGSS